MNYIVYEKKYNMFVGQTIERTELKNDKELKDFLFKHKDNLSNIEIFNKANKCEIKFEVKIK